MLALSAFAFAYSDSAQVTQLAAGVKSAVDTHFGQNPGILMVPVDYTNTSFEGHLALNANDRIHAYVNTQLSDYDLDGQANASGFLVRYKKFGSIALGNMTTTKADLFCRPLPTLSNPEYQIYFETETLQDFTDLMQRAAAACVSLQQWVAVQPTPVPTVQPQLFPQTTPSPTPVVVLTRCETDLDCVIGGCSSQLCILKGENDVTTCEWADYYSCFQRDSARSTCGCSNGKCAWDKNTLDCVAAAQAATPTPTAAPTIAPTPTPTPMPTPQPVPITDSIVIIVAALLVFGAAYYAYTQLIGKKR
ncbi:Uncharacterised protein [Candidatus Norongarragalina meridionalis]|nr:Uncharacterised protein [Candidatus Norongarragalina meridionalis]